MHSRYSVYQYCVSHSTGMAHSQGKSDFISWFYLGCCKCLHGHGMISIERPLKADRNLPSFYLFQNLAHKKKELWQPRQHSQFRENKQLQDKKQWPDTNRFAFPWMDSKKKDKQKKKTREKKGTTPLSTE